MTGMAIAFQLRLRPLVDGHQPASLVVHQQGRSATPRIVGRLESEPDRTASELLVRLQAEEAEGYPAALLRTLQRRVKVWRRAAAMRLVFTADIAATVPTGGDAATTN